MKRAKSPKIKGKIKLFLSSILCLGLFFSFGTTTLADNHDEIPPEYQNATLLPATQIELNDCKSIMNYVEINRENIIKNLFLTADREATVPAPDNITNEYSGITTTNLKANDVLGCGIKTGRIKMWMIPYYIRYILEFIINIGWLIVIGGLIYGGYLYMFGPLTDSKDKGKSAILYSIGGMILILTAWAIVNIVLSIVSI